MKSCGYCGRENSDVAANCSECGTQLMEPAGAALAARPHDRTWLQGLGRGLVFVGLILILGLLYLLSFGPVEHYCGTVISQNSTPTSYVANGQMAVLTSVRQVQYPRWVGILYHPAFMLSGNRLYRHYLQWWDEQPR